MNTPEERKRGRFAPGCSGNPSGRPRSKVTKAGVLRETLSPHMPTILQKLIDMALDGDIQACRILIDRVMPPLRPVEQAVELSLPADATLTAKGEAVLAAVSAGKIAPSQGVVLMAQLAALAKIVEVDELAKRIEALEGAGSLRARSIRDFPPKL